MNIACVLIGSLFIIGDATAREPSEAEREEAYSHVVLLTKVIHQIRRNYVDGDKTAYKDLVYGAMKGMMESLDPHSQFLDPKMYEEMREDTTGRGTLRRIGHFDWFKERRFDLGYIRLTQFSDPTARILREKLDALAAQSLKALVLDLRNNPGGLLSSAIDVSELFLERGKLIVYTEGRVKRRPDRFYSRGRKHYLGFPMAIVG